jgi:very-short-patch-repair endonuclease
MIDRFLATMPGLIGWAVHQYMDGPWVAKCESPIEKLLLSAVTYTLYLTRWTQNRSRYPLVAGKAPGDDPKLWPAFTIVPQYELGNYRIDFMVFVHGGILVAVECDGHDFHERTAAQAEHDRSRDRALQEKNIHILRFTGREIYRDPFKCAEELIMFCVRKGTEEDII